MLTFRCRSTGNSGTVLLGALLAASVTCAGQTASRAVAQSSAAKPIHAVTSTSEEQVLKAQWRRLFDNHSWDELDALASRLRSQRLRFQGGGWQLHVLYTIVSAPGSQNDSDSAWQAHIAALREWMVRSPLSPMPRIALADAYEEFAWKARGTGFSDSVTEEGWRLFGERMRAALDVLRQGEKTGRSDPEWYSSMLVATSALDWNPAKADALVNESLDKEPGYYYVARLQADNLLPKWYGRLGDTERFVANVADRVAGAEGDATYFLVAEYIITIADCSDCVNSHARGLSWPHIHRGYEAVEHLYGTNNFEHNALAFIALRYADDETARQAFAKIGENWEKDVWGSKAFFDQCRSGSVRFGQPATVTGTRVVH